jgi:hypothetical protein
MTVIEVSSKATAEELIALFDQAGAQERQLVERRALTGGEATWIVAATLAVQALGPLLRFIEQRYPTKQVKSIQVGDIKIENPTRQDVEQLLAMRTPAAPQNAPQVASPDVPQTAPQVAPQDAK